MPRVASKLIAFHFKHRPTSRPNFKMFLSLLIATIPSLPANRPSKYAILQSDGTRTSYAMVRQQIIHDKWEPVVRESAIGCEIYAEWCKTRPEMLSCEYSGPAPMCTWSWRKGQASMTVVTFVDGDEVESIRQSGAPNVQASTKKSQTSERPRAATSKTLASPPRQPTLLTSPTAGDDVGKSKSEAADTLDHCKIH